MPRINHPRSPIKVNELLAQAEKPIQGQEAKELADEIYKVSSQVSPEEARRLISAADTLYANLGGESPSRGTGGAAGAQLLAAEFKSSAVEASADFFQKDLTPVQQWLFWETNASFKEVRRPFKPVQLEVVHAPKDDVTYRGLRDDLLPNDVLEVFQKSDHFAWPKHPGNTLTSLRLSVGVSVPIPYAETDGTETWKGWFTASRSMVVETPDSDKLLSVKLPTNFPTPLQEEAHKTNLVNHTDIAVRRGTHIVDVDAKGVAHPALTLQPDVLAVFDKESKNGFTVRDVSSFKDDQHLYMPGFAFPLYGPEMGMKSDDLMKEFAPIWGKSKALLLMRYGMYLKSPHGQNTVFQLDQNRKLTGHVTLRDLSDTSFVGPIASALGYGDKVNADRDDGYTVGEKIEEDWNLSIPGLDHDGYFSYGQLLEAKGLHDQEFIETVFAELDKADPAYRSFQQECTTLPELQEFLFSADGQRALAEYGKKVLSL